MWLYKFKTIESLVCLFNLIFILTGCAITTVGIYMELNKSWYFDFIATSDPVTEFFLSSKLVVIFGALLIAYSMLAVFSSCAPDKNQHRQCGFAVIMGLILFAEICAVSILFIYKDRTFQIISNSMIKSVADYKKHKTDSIRYSWDSIQQDFECCGITNFDSWKMDNKTLLLDSCCYQSKFEHCTVDSHQVWEIGCLQVLSDFVNAKSFISCMIGSVIVMIQLIDVISAFCLVMKFKNHATYQKVRDLNS